MVEENEAALDKKILNAPLTEATHFRVQYNTENCVLYLFNGNLNRCYATGITKEDAKAIREVLTAYINETSTVDFKAMSDYERLYG